jgi:ribosomal protein S18 acetylase RimI-like enzyme
MGFALRRKKHPGPRNPPQNRSDFKPPNSSWPLTRIVRIHAAGKSFALRMTRIMAGNNYFEIQAVAQKDWPAILDVYHQCEDFLALGPEPHASMAMVQKDIELSRQAGGIYCGVVPADGKMIGVVDYIPRNFEGESRAAFISLLMIAAPFRKRGIGTAVVEFVENEIRKDHRITIILSGVQANNDGGLQFWQKQGYRIVSGPELQPDRTITFRLRKDWKQKT